MQHCNLDVVRLGTAYQVALFGGEKKGGERMTQGELAELNLREYLNAKSCAALSALRMADDYANSRTLPRLLPLLLDAV